MLRFFTFSLLFILFFTAACGPSESAETALPKPVATTLQISTLRSQSTATTAAATVLIPTSAEAQVALVQQVNALPGFVIVDTTLLNVHQSADTNSPVIATLAFGECVSAILQEGDWYALRLADGRLGWSSTDYLFSRHDCLTSPPVAEVSAVQAVSHATKAIVTTSVLNVRTGPGEAFNIVSQVTQNDCLDVLTTQDGWFHIKNDARLDGWASQQYMALQESCPPVMQPVAAAAGASFIGPVTSSSYQGQPYAPDAMAIQDAYIFECFGSGNNELRFVTASTPVQVLGIGDFAAPYPELGSGPFIKIRIWDGQYAWIRAEAVNTETNILPSLSGQCETYDRIEWSTIVQPTPTQIIATPTAYPSWMTDSPQQQSSGCCKICRKGKACGDSCISANYTCHKGSGCACNG